MSSNSKTPELLMQEALALHRLQKFDAARQIYWHAIAKKPHDIELWIMLSILEGQDGKAQIALNHLNHALCLDPNRVDIHHNMGLIAFELSQHLKASEHFSSALRIDPHNKKILYSKGRNHYALDEMHLAFEHFQEAHQIDPTWVDPILNMGNVAWSKKNHSQAMNAFNSVIALEPSHFGAWFNKGKVLSELQKLDSAIACFETSLAIEPNQSSTLMQFALTLQALHQPHSALETLSKALSLEPQNTSIFYAQGLIHLQLKQWQLAIESLDQGLQLNPLHPEALYNRGLAQQQLSRYDLALESYNKAIQLRSDFAQAYYSKALVFFELKFHQPAIEQYDLAIQYKPDYCEALTNKGIALKEIKSFSHALVCYENALLVNPFFSEACNNRGNVLLDLQHKQLALESFNKALVIEPNNVIALTNRGNIFHEMRQFDKATRSFELAMMVDPSHHDAYWNLSLSLLACGDYEKGWAYYEHRWSMPNFSISTRRLKEPLWLGHEDLREKTILLQAEQGLGDSLQFVRFTHDVLALGAKVLLEVPPALIRIFKESFPQAQCITDQANDLPAFDFHTPLMSLPHALGVNLKSLSGNAPYLPSHSHESYLKTPHHRLQEFNLKLSSRLNLTKPLKIGLCWRGNPKHQNDANRSIPLQICMDHLTRNANFCHWISLQVDALPHESVSSVPHEDSPIDFSDELKDFTDTAALIANLDLVISVDSSVAHLSAALGCPTWILLAANPDWRWLYDRQDSPWYPSVKLYRQKVLQHWPEVLWQVQRDLLHFTPAKSSPL